MLSQPFIACVFGNPIEQSRSPIIHSMFAAQFDITLDYQKRLAGPTDFIASANAFFANEFCIGANVTMPFKHDAWKWVNELSVQARRAGAVNTIIRKPDNVFLGDNTDGIGLVVDLHNHGVNLQGAKVLLIGAGGAAKGALPALIDAGISSVAIYNRSADKAQTLVDSTNQYWRINDTSPAPVNMYNLVSHTHFDLIINATSLSLQNQLPDLPDSIFVSQPCVYDMVYLPKSTAFMVKAKQLGCTTCIDGLGMLVNQAAHSFYLWFDKKPNCDPVYQHLRQLTAQ